MVGGNPTPIVRGGLETREHGMNGTSEAKSIPYTHCATYLRNGAFPKFPMVGFNSISANA